MQIVKNLNGAHTNRPYRVKLFSYMESVPFYVVEAMGDSGHFSELGEFDTQGEAEAYIAKFDLASQLEVDEIKYNVQ